jgi:hypothetical protein
MFAQVLPSLPIHVHNVHVLLQLYSHIYEFIKKKKIMKLIFNYKTEIYSFHLTCCVLFFFYLHSLLLKLYHVKNIFINVQLECDNVLFVCLLKKKMDVFMHNMSSERTNKRNKTQKNCNAPRE